MMLNRASTLLAFGLVAFKVASSTNLNVTVITAQGGQSRFECWQLCAPFTSSSQSGLLGTQTANLGNVANMTYNVVPAGYDSGFHTAPANQ